MRTKLIATPKKLFLFREEDRYITVTRFSGYVAEVEQLQLVAIKEAPAIVKRNIASELEKWLLFRTVGVAHPTEISVFRFSLEYSSSDEVNNLYIAMTERGSVEGLFTLGYHGTSWMEIAPWNRAVAGHTPALKGVGAQLRSSALKKLIRRHGDRLFEPPLVSNVITLGYRDQKADVFNALSVAKQDILDYIQRQDRIAAECEAESQRVLAA